MEETEVDLRVPHDPVSQMQAVEEYRRTGKREKRTVNTRNILFIMSGAFNDLAPMVRNRLQKQGIGFGATVQSKEDDYKFLKDTRAEDLIVYGFESEFIGRLPVIAVLERLEIEDLYEILRNPNNPIILGKKDDFRAYGSMSSLPMKLCGFWLNRLSGKKPGPAAWCAPLNGCCYPSRRSCPAPRLSTWW